MNSNTQKHDGEVLRRSVFSSGYTIAGLARKLFIERRTIYNHFKMQSIPDFILLKYWNVIDISELFPKDARSNLKNAETGSIVNWLIEQNKILHKIVRDNEVIIKKLIILDEKMINPNPEEKRGE